MDFMPEEFRGKESQRLFCYLEERISMKRSFNGNHEGEPELKFMANKPMGINSISETTKIITTCLELPNRDRFTFHGLRRTGATLPAVDLKRC